MRYQMLLINRITGEELRRLSTISEAAEWAVILNKHRYDACTLVEVGWNGFGETTHILHVQPKNIDLVVKDEHGYNLVLSIGRDSLVAQDEEGNYWKYTKL